jgi:hypothetical protein
VNPASGLLRPRTRNRRTYVLFSSLDRRTHPASAARLITECRGLHSRPSRLISAAWECSHARADSCRVFAPAAQSFDGPKRLAP